MIDDLSSVVITADAKPFHLMTTIVYFIIKK